jgi:hypothetical protein
MLFSTPDAWTAAWSAPLPVNGDLIVDLIDHLVSTYDDIIGCFANKSKTTTWKNQNKNTGLYINCMDFVVVRIKINKK